MIKLNDKVNRRLVVIGESATFEFWDRCWDLKGFQERVKEGSNKGIVKTFTESFLQPGAKILEGGCGIGQNVFGLRMWGFDAFGVDYAQETVKKVNQAFPDLAISGQDVRNLNFESGFFDGYWSLGVIEHFWEGYEDILKEATRVLRSGGYLFLTFPYMSPLRKIKSFLGLYGALGNCNVKEFYQFILDKKQVVKKVEKQGFALIASQPFGELYGMQDEIILLRNSLKKLSESKNIFFVILRYILSLLLTPLSSHSVLLVFKKT